MWFVYVDRTRAGFPFYVGKGNAGRLRSLNRSKKHANIVAKHGCVRTIVLKTDVEEDALEAERHFIREFITYAFDQEASQYACNFTEGGDGVSGLKHSEQTKQRMCNTHTGRKRKPCSIETKKKISEALTGRKLTPEHIENHSKSIKGQTRSQSTKRKISEARVKYWKRRREGGC